MGEARAAGLKSLVYHQQSVKYKSTTMKTSCTATFSKDRCIGGAYSIDLNIPGKLICPIKKKKKKKKHTPDAVLSFHNCFLFIVLLHRQYCKPM